MANPGSGTLGEVIVIKRKGHKATLRVSLSVAW